VILAMVIDDNFIDIGDQDDRDYDRGDDHAR
jgi:hypothetical protein